MSLDDTVDVPGPWEHRRVGANGARFHVAVLGDGPLVVLLHGYPEFWWAWRHQIEPIAEAGWRVAALDLRGYGGSDKTPRGYDPATFTADVAGVIRTLGARDAVIVGHDWGAYIAWAMAVIRPTHVRAVAALSMPHPLVLRRGLLRGRHARHLVGIQLPMVPERQLVGGDAAHVEALLRHWAAPDSKFPDPEAAARYRAAMSLWPAPHCALEYQRWAVRSLFRVDGRRFARRMAEPISAPVFQIHGGADRTIPPQTASRSSGHVTGPYRWLRLEDVGHFPHEEEPDRVTAALLDWLPTLR
ncbi:MAG: alpha/beta fold hydrolase [bacterium]